MRVLVTRPRSDAEETAARLSRLGHESLIAPLLEIRYRDGDAISLEGIQSVLVTSANGVRALVRRTAERHVPIFAVGRQSAEEARAAGFLQVHSAEGGSAALATAVAGWAEPGRGPLLHVSGNDIAGDLQGTLETTGLDVKRSVLYDAVTAESLPGDAEEALRKGALDAVLLFSARSSASFVAGIAKAGLQQACNRLLAVAISPASAVPLASLSFRALRIAAAPNQDAMLERLGS